MFSWVAVFYGVLYGLWALVVMTVPGVLLDRWDRWRGVPKGEIPKDAFGVVTGWRLWVPITLLFAFGGAFVGVLSCFFSGDFLP